MGVRIGWQLLRASSERAIPSSVGAAHYVHLAEPPGANPVAARFGLSELGKPALSIRTFQLDAV